MVRRQGHVTGVLKDRQRFQAVIGQRAEYECHLGACAGEAGRGISEVVLDEAQVDIGRLLAEAADDIAHLRDGARRRREADDQPG